MYPSFFIACIKICIKIEIIKQSATMQLETERKNVYDFLGIHCISFYIWTHDCVYRKYVFT